MWGFVALFTQILTTLWLSHDELLRCTVSCELGWKTNIYGHYFKEYTIKVATKVLCSYSLLTTRMIFFWFIFNSFNGMSHYFHLCSWSWVEEIKILYLTEQWSNISGNRRRQRYDAKEAGKNQTQMLKPLANGRNILECYMLRPFALPVACFCVLLGVVAQFGLNRSSFRANNSQHFFCSVIAEAWRNNNVGGKLIEISRDCQSINQSINQLINTFI